jgi:hypothetical protein
LNVISGHLVEKLVVKASKIIPEQKHSKLEQQKAVYVV